ncbi:GCFC-domain-containing protein [Gloeophyllum trabeum ATCC 11539]|uniref:GCFC-domain-containing protein n=1 Tax=Gloeophyllum trabeum (strain ATCC 11539 / FP-39264 / Madison 617) TaxID=670483 RepID=S7REZ7_GLOTA|nr:GCFC-domain-containing protein [Gloeophyllum trabeum ATCC 11539]EPQ51044.1 GCFC-domain-containing protein [Gloeophyllum trabeum ATCC 11539]
MKLKKKTRAKPKSRLSFGGADEAEEGEVFQIKKSNLSSRISLGKAPGSPGVPSVESSPRSSGPVYDQAYLSQLKASTPTSRPRLAGDESVDMSMSVDGDNSIALAASDVFADTDTAIPSASSIQAAKEKRERLRTTAPAAEDFISLSLTKREDNYQGPHPESRLVREEDELGEAEEEFAEYTSAQERIALGKKSKKVEAAKKREEMQELIAEAEEVDEETIEWEQEQLRRGGHRPEEIFQPAKEVYKPAPIPMETPIPTLASAIGRLTQSLTALTTSHAQNTSTVESLAEERIQLEAREREMREMIAEAEAKRSWFAAFRDWVESVATFLDEKYPELEKLEDEHVSLLRERHDMISKRRRDDDADDLSLFLGTLPVSSAADVDELGRAVEPLNAASRKDRRAARISRRSNRQRRSAPSSDEEEGYSTDSSLAPSDAADYQTAMGGLSLKVRDVLADVQADDFKDPGLGLGKWFGEWRQRFGDTYTGAWGGLGMVGAWEFWVRLELLGWDPLEDHRSLDSFDWYTSLYQYSRPQDEDEEPALGPDGDLVSAMISTAVIPRLVKVVVGGAFDPYSAKHVGRIIDLAEEVEASIEPDNLKFQTLLKSVFQLFSGAVTDMEALVAPYLAQSVPRFDPEAIPARRRILARQMKLLRNILRWRKYTSGKFGIGELGTRLVRDSMLPIAESGWEVGGEEAVRKIADIMPDELLPASVKTRLAIS